MYRMLLYLSAIFLYCMPIKSQVTITFSELNFKPGNTAEYRQLTDDAVWGILDEAGNTPGGTWDFSKLGTLDELRYLLRLDVEPTDFYPDASYKLNNTYTMADIELTAREFEKAGENELVRLGLDLDSSYIVMGGMGTDLTIKKQKADYTPGLIKMKFPLEFNPDNETKSECTRKILGIANIPGMGISNADIIYQVNYTRVFSVSNWGKLKLYGSDEDIEALVFKYKETTIDTVWMNGSLLPDFMLEPLGLKQGAKNETEGVIFYGKGYDNYLINAGKLTNQYGSQTFSGFGLSQLVTDIREGNNNNSFKMFPNPSNGIFSLILPNTCPGAYCVSIYNIMGSKVHESLYKNEAENINLKINMGNDMPEGTYNLVITNPGHKITYSGKIVLMR